MQQILRHPADRSIQLTCTHRKLVSSARRPSTPLAVHWCPNPFLPRCHYPTATRNRNRRKQNALRSPIAAHRCVAQAERKPTRPPLHCKTLLGTRKAKTTKTGAASKREREMVSARARGGRERDCRADDVSNTFRVTPDRHTRTAQPSCRDIQLWEGEGRLKPLWPP